MFVFIFFAGGWFELEAVLLVGVSRRMNQLECRLRFVLVSSSSPSSDGSVSSSSDSLISLPLGVGVSEIGGDSSL